MTPAHKMSIPIARTDLTEDEILSVLEPLRSGWLVQGRHVRDFEEQWSAFTGVSHSVAVTSCTSALHLSLAALGFGPGDEAIVPAFTWISTANVVEHLGGRVVFCDINLDTFNLNVQQLESLITPQTRAIIPVHLFGPPADMRAVMAVAAKHDLLVVEDAACGFGSRIEGTHVGSFGHSGCFSFHPRKAITTGEGGMITTNDDHLAETLRRLRDHGAAVSDSQRHFGPKPYLLADHPIAGYNQRMTDFQAALGVAQMKRADQILSARRRLGHQLNHELHELEWLRLPLEPEGYQHGYQSYPCLFHPAKVKKAISQNNAKAIGQVGGERNAWMNSLHLRGISTRPATHAVHTLTYYVKKYGLRPFDFPNAFAAHSCSLSLPLFPGMTGEELDYLVRTVRRGDF